MKKCYINGMSCVSAQETFNSVFLEDAKVNENDNVLPAIKPDYKEFIAAAAGRRMAIGVKNGIAASARALKEAGVIMPDAIITGTGMGCSADSEKFLKAILDNDEQFLTPTSFIQSTHNTVGAQIALGLECKGYNFTYVNGSVSFESALIDAKMQIDEGTASQILTGGIDELAENTVEFGEIIGSTKSGETVTFNVLNSVTGGSVMSEGAVFFVLSDTKQETSYASLTDFAIYNVLDREEVKGKATEFLKVNNLLVSDIDAVVLGFNGDVNHDGYYRQLSDTLFADTQQVYYKHLCGEFNTASAFGLWMAAKMMRQQEIPTIIQVNQIQPKSLKTILLYNQYKGRDHSFTLLSAL